MGDFTIFTVCAVALAVHQSNLIIIINNNRIGAIRTYDVVTVQANIYFVNSDFPCFGQLYIRVQIVVPVRANILQILFIIDGSPYLAIRMIIPIGTGALCAADGMCMLASLHCHSPVQRRANILQTRHIQLGSLRLVQCRQGLVYRHQLCLEFVRVLRGHFLRQGVDESLRCLHRCILCHSIAAADVFNGGGGLCGVLAGGFLAGGGNISSVLAVLCLLFRHCTRFFRKCRHGHHGKAEYKCQNQTQYSFLHKILL